MRRGRVWRLNKFRLGLYGCVVSFFTLVFCAVRLMLVDGAGGADKARGRHDDAGPQRIHG